MPSHYCKLGRLQRQFQNHDAYFVIIFIDNSIALYTSYMNISFTLRFGHVARRDVDNL